jgi:acetyl esterase/lipase
MSVREPAVTDIDVVAGVRSVRDIVYASPPGFRPLSLDLYLPTAPTSTLCLYLHGGGWRIGSRRDGPGTAAGWAPSFFEQVAALGLAIASVDYRLSGEAQYPAQQADVSAAAQFLHDHASELGLATSRTVVWGVSAGGQLAAMHALAPGSQVASAVCWYSPSELNLLSVDVEDAGGQPDRSAGSREGALIGASLDDRPDLVEAASPLHAVRVGAPPFLLLHGNADRAVPPRQSDRLADALRAVGSTAVVEIVDGATHMFPELGDDQTLAIVRRSVAFLLDIGS